jgi:PleD family two-component response regulator
MSIRILLVESDLDDALFLRDVLADIEAGRHWETWVPLESTHVASWSEASSVLASDRFDIVLLNPTLDDSPAAETFQHLREIASLAPVILLLARGEESLAARFVREGIQDFLIKPDIDCGPLAHAIRNAIERHRFLAAIQAGAVRDSLTGLPNRTAFLTLAGRDRDLAMRLGVRMMVLVAEPRNLEQTTSAFGPQRRDLCLVESADSLRRLTAPTDILARIDESRFAVSLIETREEPLESAWARFHSASELNRLSVGAAIFDPERPVPFDLLLEQAALDMNPSALAMQT